jgi:hypothetical protein
MSEYVMAVDPEVSMLLVNQELPNKSPHNPRCLFRVTHSESPEDEEKIGSPSGGLSEKAAAEIKAGIRKVKLESMGVVPESPCPMMVMRPTKAEKVGDAVAEGVKRENKSRRSSMFRTLDFDSEDEGDEDEHPTHFAFYETDPYKVARCRILKSAIMAVSEFESAWRLQCLRICGVIVLSITHSVKVTLNANPDFKRATMAGRPDIMLFIMRKMNVSGSGAMQRQNFYDVRIHNLFVRMFEIRQQPKETLEAYIKRFDEQLEGIGLMGGFVQESKNFSKPLQTFVVNLLGHMFLHGLGSEFAKKIATAMDKDELKFPECTLEWIKRKALDWWMMMQNTKDLSKNQSNNQNPNSDVKANKASKAPSGDKDVPLSKFDKMVGKAVQLAVAEVGRNTAAAADKIMSDGYDKKRVDEKKTQNTPQAKCDFCGKGKGHWTGQCTKLTQELKDEYQVIRDANRVEWEKTKAAKGKSQKK